MLWMGNMEEWTGMPFEDLLKKTEESGVDLSLKRPTLGSRMVEDKTRQRQYLDLPLSSLSKL